MDDNNDNKTIDPKKKFLVKGEVNVGKSNIVRRLLGHDYEELEATIGVEFGFVEVTNIDKDDPSVSLNVQVWDTSGAERYRAITTSHIRKADGALLIYDISSESSFNQLEFWFEAIKKATSDQVVIYLVGNKVDLVKLNENFRRIYQDRAQELAKRLNIKLFDECSAKDNYNIEEIFNKLYKDIYAVQKDKFKEKFKNLQLNDKKSDDKDAKNISSCC